MKSDGERNALGSRPNSALLKATKHLWLQLHTISQNERADSQRSMKLMRRDGHRIDAEIAEVKRNLADGLNGVGVNWNSHLTTYRRGFADGLDNACLVIGEHKADEPRHCIQPFIEPIINNAI